MNPVEAARRIKRWIFNPTPTRLVLRELRRRGVRVRDLDALEVFGKDGTGHTVEYVSRVKSLEVWEWDPQCEALLRRNLPGAEIKITDSYLEIQKTPKRYDLIVVDNPGGPWADHCEHFDLFPHLFRVARDPSILILDVIPEADPVYQAKYPSFFNAVHLERRRAFYRTERPERVTLEDMFPVYEAGVREQGFAVEWRFTQRRGMVHYLVLKIRRADQRPTRASSRLASSPDSER